MFRHSWIQELKYIQGLAFFYFSALFLYLIYVLKQAFQTQWPSEAQNSNPMAKSFTFLPISTKSPGRALIALACVMSFPRQSPWPRGWKSLCDRAWVICAFLKPNVPHMTQSGKGMSPQRGNEGQMLAWQTKTTEMHCGFFLWVSF